MHPAPSPESVKLVDLKDSFSSEFQGISGSLPLRPRFSQKQRGSLPRGKRLSGFWTERDTQARWPARNAEIPFYAVSADGSQPGRKNAGDSDALPAAGFSPFLRPAPPAGESFSQGSAPGLRPSFQWPGRQRLIRNRCLSGMEQKPRERRQPRNSEKNSRRGASSWEPVPPWLCATWPTWASLRGSTPTAK